MRKIGLLLAMMAVAMLLASGVGLLNAVKPAQATFPGVNGRIAYAGLVPDESNTDIFTMNPNGGDAFNVTESTDGAFGSDDSLPSYSPDGNKLVYVNFEENESGEASNTLYTINATGGDRTKVVASGSGYWYWPTFSPTGDRIAYAGTDDSAGSGGDNEIYTVNATGGGRVKVTNNALDDGQPDYAPSGQRIAFSAWDGKDDEIYTIKTGGGGRIQLTNNSTNDVEPSYSPDGTRIAFASNRSGSYEIYTMNTSGGGVLQVTRNRVDDFSPVYSPDGKRLAYSGLDGVTFPDFEIYKISPGGGIPTQITNNDTNDEWPSWGSSR